MEQSQSSESVGQNHNETENVVVLDIVVTIYTDFLEYYIVFTITLWMNIAILMIILYPTSIPLIPAYILILLVQKIINIAM